MNRLQAPKKQTQTNPISNATTVFRLLHKRLPPRGVYPERSRRGTRNYIFFELPCKEWLPGLEKRWHYELIGGKIV